MKKNLSVFIIVFLSLLALVIISLVIINGVVKGKIENFVQNRMPENIVPAYKKLTIDYFGGTIKLDSVTLFIKNKSDGVMHTQISVEKVIVEDVSYWDYLFNKQIHIEDIKIKQPTIHYFKDKIVSNKDSTYSKPLRIYKPILVDELKIYDANLTIIDSTKDSLFLYSKNLTVEIRDILLNDSIVGQRLPVHFEKYKASADSIFMKVGNYENLSVENFKIEDRKAIFNTIILKTKYSQSQLSKIITIERDHFNVEIPQLIINNIDFGFINRKFFAKSTLIELGNVNAHIFRDKLVGDDLKIKSLYSKMLRDMPILLTIDSLKINNGTLKYTEKVKEENNGGSINFSKLNVAIANVSNTYASPTKTKIALNAFFMEATPIKVAWEFDVNNTIDTFLFQAEIGKLQSHKLNTFTRPNLKVKLEGETMQTYFTVSGNYESSIIDMRIAYDDFKLNILNKDGKEKNKILSAVANLLFSKDSEKNGDNFREGRGHVTRDQTKSVFNFLWLNVKEGLIRSITGIPDKIDRKSNAGERKQHRQHKRAERNASRKEN